jgi:hypothetical protein
LYDSGKQAVVQEKTNIQIIRNIDFFEEFIVFPACFRKNVRPVLPGDLPPGEAAPKLKFGNSLSG